MRILKITAAIAATTAVATAQAASVSGGGLDGAATDGGTATHVSAVAIVAPTAMADALRTMQGFDAACQGNTSILCAPSISSGELRSILSNAVSNAGNINGGGTDLRTELGLTVKNAGVKEYAAAGVKDALAAFSGSVESVGGFKCGQALSNTYTNTTANDAATLTGTASASVAFGFVHATELDGSLGFIKLDGVAPNAISLASSNYNLVSNLSGTFSVPADASFNGTTLGVVAAGAGVASHQGQACRPLSTGAAVGDANGGSI